jgi:predicted phage tail protein
MRLADVIRTARSFKVDHARQFAQHVVPEVVKPARVIWNQAIGAIFILFAVLFFGNAVRYYTDLHANSHNGLALAFSIFLGAVMAIFGVASLLKARRIGRR